MRILVLVVLIGFSRGGHCALLHYWETVGESSPCTVLRPAQNGEKEQPVRGSVQLERKRYYRPFSWILNRGVPSSVARSRSFADYVSYGFAAVGAYIGWNYEEFFITFPEQRLENAAIGALSGMLPSWPLAFLGHRLTFPVRESWRLRFSANGETSYFEVDSKKFVHLGTFLSDRSKLVVLAPTTAHFQPVFATRLVVDIDKEGKVEQLWLRREPPISLRHSFATAPVVIEQGTLIAWDELSLSDERADEGTTLFVRSGDTFYQLSVYESFENGVVLAAFNWDRYQRRDFPVYQIPPERIWRAPAWCGRLTQPSNPPPRDFWLAYTVGCPDQLTRARKNDSGMLR